VSRVLPAFKDTNKKYRVYERVKLGLVQINRYIALGFELPIPDNGTRKRGLLTVQNHAQVHRKRKGDLVPFSPRRVLPGFVNPRIRSKLLRLSI
jgi:hypothetical protein